MSKSVIPKIVSVILFFLLMVFPILGTAEDGVRLVCDEPMYQYGHIDQSAVVTNVFTIRNEGDLTFVFKSLRATCGCTRGRIDKRMIGPGGTAKVTAVFTAKRRRGPQKKSLKLYSVHLEKPVLIFYMEGFVDPPDDSH